MDFHVKCAHGHGDDNISLGFNKFFDHSVVEVFLAPDDYVIFCCPVFFVDLDPALCHLRIPFFDLSVQDVIKIGVAFDKEEKMVSSVGIGIEGEAGDHVLKDVQKDHHAEGGNIHSRADGKSQTGCQPDSGSSGQTFDTASHFENNTCAQKADAADDLGRDTGGVGVPRAEAGCSSPHVRSAKPYLEISMIRAVVTQTMMWVLVPASLNLRVRSAPMKPPTIKDRRMRRQKSAYWARVNCEV